MMELADSIVFDRVIDIGPKYHSAVPQTMPMA